MDSSLVILAQTSEGSFLDPILSSIVDLWDWLPGLGQVGILIVLAIVCAKLAAWILTGLIGRWVGKTETTVDDELIKLMHRPVFLIVLFLGLGMAVERAGLSEKALWVTTAILKTIGLIVLIGFSIRASRLILDALSRNQDRFPLIQSRTLPLFYNVSLLVIIGGALYFLFIAWNIDATAWLASAGVIGLALSFAAKDSLANLFAGAFILADAPYKIGDFVVLDSGERGRVTHIGLRSTRMLTRDDVEITIPNAVMGNSKITNESGGPYEKERIRVQVGVAYGTDIDRVEELLMAIAVSHSEILEDPEPRVRFRTFGESSLDFELLGWIREPVLRGRLRHLLCKEIYKCFMEEGIEIPYPKRDVYLQGTAESPSLSGD
ncbi:MAG: mechanosensitive ion channel protein [Planctomycetes bacterium]|nr:mechanosensitive ion channel protein [Planctomycetota bacterium]MBL04697.1 mechanosensitive ion channel protein [Planctomycetota bacterium]|tara:strand:- start:199 stop:1332 length:1134 start_codon:yes stop_codon:yes gene_type:complete